MKQITAIRRAFEVQGFYDEIRRRGDWWQGRIRGMPWATVGHAEEVCTVDHNGHSTRVYARHHLVATVHGTVET